MNSLQESAGKIKLAAVSLGCSKNRIDTEEIFGFLAGNGMILTDDWRLADIIIVNTCGFIEQAQQESINTILEIAQKKKKNVRLIVTGCLVEVFGSALLKRIPEVNGALGVHSYKHIKRFMKIILNNRRVVIKNKAAEKFSSLSSRILTAPPHSVNVKIAEGCSNYCHYCLIPKIRGHYRSRRPEEIVDEIKRLVESGTSEIVLIAQDTTAYGCELEDSPDLSGLIEKIMGLKHNFWLRIMYTYPSRINKSLLEIIAKETRVCSYLDIPIQHVNDKILSDMSRFYRKKELTELLVLIRKMIPNIVLRTTCMVGYPGESKRQFDEMLEFIQEYPFEQLGAFAYSAQKDTISAGMAKQVPQRVINKRLHRLMAKQQKIAHLTNLKMVGINCMVIVDKEAAEGGKWYYGRTEFQAPDVDGGVFFRSAVKHKQGDWVSVKICAAAPYNLLALKTAPIK